MGAEEAKEVCKARGPRKVCFWPWAATGVCRRGFHAESSTRKPALWEAGGRDGAAGFVLKAFTVRSFTLMLCSHPVVTAL